jgi:nicotinamide-nucleotide amidase
MYGPPMLPAALTTPAAEIADKLGAAGQTLAVAESSAGGLISASLLSVAGASRYYRGGFVTYTHDGTRAVLADATDLEPGDRGACEPFARFLASAARGKLSADWSVSETGASGPTGNRYGDPPGHATGSCARSTSSPARTTGPPTWGCSPPPRWASC